MLEIRHHEQEASGWCIHACLHSIAAAMGRSESQHDFAQASTRGDGLLAIDFLRSTLDAWGLKTVSATVDVEFDDCTTPEAFFDALQRFCGAVMFVPHDVIDAILAPLLDESRMGPASHSLHAVIIVAASSTEVLVFDPFRPSRGQPARLKQEQLDPCFYVAPVVLFA